MIGIEDKEESWKEKETRKRRSNFIIRSLEEVLERDLQYS